MINKCALKLATKSVLAKLALPLWLVLTVQGIVSIASIFTILTEQSYPKSIYFWAGLGCIEMVLGVCFWLYLEYQEAKAICEVARNRH